MNSLDENNPPLERLLTWRSAGKDLEILIDDPPRTRIALVGRLLDASASEFSFSWTMLSSDPDTNPPFLRSKGVFTISLDGSSVSMDAPNNAVSVFRETRACVLREIN
jgi:hypothetical protein